MTLTACLLSCSALSQSNDSLKCFTLEQVKVFLTTKVELNNCLQQYNSLFIEAEITRSKNVKLESDNLTLKKKVKRNRGFAIGFGAGLVGVLVLLFGIK